MVNADDWKDKLVLGKKYHIIARFTNADGIFIGIGIKDVSKRQDPVFQFGEVNMMLPWEGIEIFEIVE
jgi:hypothetical protein